jgi:hypothetical protein
MPPPSGSEVGRSQIGIEAHDGDIGHHAEHEPAEDEEDRIGDQNSPGNRLPGEYGAERYDDRLELM